MELSQLFTHRSDILEQSKDDNGFYQQGRVLSDVLPLLLDAKLVDSEDFTDCYFNSSYSDMKINGYSVNESGERLQLYIVADDSLNTDLQEELFVSNRKDYEKYFKKVGRFISSSMKGDLSDVQESEPIKPLISKLTTIDGLNQFDVIEIFLITLSATVTKRGDSVQPRRIFFKDEVKKVSYNFDGEKIEKDLLFIHQVIDLNFISNVLVSRGNREPLKVIFSNLIDEKIEVIKAADESNFQSYLCVLNAEILSSLYKRYSSQLLEKNVRSFLQFKGVNKGIKQTIKEAPEKFIAYNNGLTITATAASIKPYKKSIYLESLDDFQIVNGGQTTASIYFSQKEGLDISKVKVMAKINVAKDCKESELDDLISKISEFSNTQSRVSKVDLRSRSPQLIKLKGLSTSVVTPSGHKWFFERAKGDFNTQVRKSSNGAAMKKDFPTERRFTKELLAKYYCAWSDVPFMVKKGGESIFRRFIEHIEPESGEKVEIDRDFYEKLIAIVILFRRMEKIYGQGKNSMGQLRSAAIPYALSVIYSYTDGSSSGTKFDLGKIWKNESLEEELEQFITQLLLIINDAIKNYSLSDDYGEYSKKKELWERIIESKEVKNFMLLNDSIKVLKKYEL